MTMVFMFLTQIRAGILVATGIVPFVVLIGVVIERREIALDECKLIDALETETVRKREMNEAHCWPVLLQSRT